MSKHRPPMSMLNGFRQVAIVGGAIGNGFVCKSPRVLQLWMQQPRITSMALIRCRQAIMQSRAGVWAWSSTDAQPAGNAAP